MNDKPLLIGLTGLSGSGKTTFLHQLQNVFSNEQLCIISQDNYYRPKSEQLIDNQGITNFDLPSSINEQEFVADVLKLLSGQQVEREEYTFNNPHKKPEMLIFKPRPVIILEGLFVFHYETISRLLDLRVFLYAKEATALARRIKRDRIERNYPLEDVLYRYENHVLPTYEKYIKPLKSKADIIINNNENFDRGFEVLRGYLANYLTARTLQKQTF